MNLSFKHIILCLFLLNPEYIVNICFSHCTAVSKRRNNLYSLTNIQQSVWPMNTYSIIPLVGKYLITQLLCNLIKNFEYSSFQLSIDKYLKNTLIPSAHTQIFSAVWLLNLRHCWPHLRPVRSAGPSSDLLRQNLKFTGLTRCLLSAGIWCESGNKISNVLFGQADPLGE